jgi:hypothetical protein
MSPGRIISADGLWSSAQRQFGPEHSGQTHLTGCGSELDSTIKTIMICQSHGAEPKFRCPISQVGGLAGTVQEAEGAVGVQFGVFSLEPPMIAVASSTRRVRWAFLAGDGYLVVCPAGRGRPACLAGVAQ